MVKHNFQHFIGEDIELANRALSQATQGVRGQAQVSMSIGLVWLGRFSGQILSSTWYYAKR